MRTEFLKKANLLNLLIPAGFLVLNFILKLVYLDHSPIGNDEPFSIFVAQMNVPSIVGYLSLGNNPPLYEIILHYWMQIFGISAFSVRFLPLIFSTLTVLFVYKIGISFFNSRIAILSGLIFTFANYHIYFAHETRVYSLFALLTAISMFSFMSLIKNRSSNRHLAIWILSNILLIYSHFFGLFIPIIQTLCILLFKDIREGLWKKYFLGIGILAVSYLPYLKILISRFIESAEQGTWVAPSTFTDLYTMLWRFSNAPVTTVIFLILILAALIKWGLSHFEKASIYSRIVFTWFLFPYLFMFIISMKYLPFNIPMFFDRYVVFISLAFYIIVAISVDSLFSGLKYRKYLLLIPALLMILTCKPDSGNKRDVPALVNKVKELQTTKSLTYIYPEWFDLNFTYYYNQDYFKVADGDTFKAGMVKLLGQENIYPIHDFNEIDTIRLREADKVIMIVTGTDFEFPDKNLTGYLAEFFPKQQTISYSDVYIVKVHER